MAIIWVGTGRFAAPAFDFLNPANIGQPAGGGYFGGLISHTADGNPTHALIVAPRATGASGTGYPTGANLALKTSNTATAGTTSVFDGLANTAAMVAAGIAIHPAAGFCVGLSIGGLADWYLPALFEREIAYFNLKPTTVLNTTDAGINPYSVPSRANNYTAGVPAQTAVTLFSTGGSEVFPSQLHWSSSEVAASSSWQINFSNGGQLSASKTAGRHVRAFRRIAL
jgi:hypothetical protein